MINSVIGNVKHIHSTSKMVKNVENEEAKTKLLEEGIFFLINLIARDNLVMKKLKIEKTKPTFMISVLKVEC